VFRVLVLCNLVVRLKKPLDLLRQEQLALSS
jgi:hypothetical protein